MLANSETMRCCSSWYCAL